MARRRSPAGDVGYRVPAYGRPGGLLLGRVSQAYGVLQQAAPTQSDLRELTCAVREMVQALQDLAARMPARGEVDLGEGRECPECDDVGGSPRRRTTSGRARRSSRAPRRRVTRRVADAPAMPESASESTALPVSELDRAAARAVARRAGMIVRGPVESRPGGRR